MRLHLLHALFTKEQGRCLGVYNKKVPPEIGTLTHCRWRARLSEQLGTYYLEEGFPLSIGYLEDKKRLACISSLCHLLDDFLPERQVFQNLYEQTLSFFEQLESSQFLKYYILWERDLLAEIGFGLELTECAAGGDSQNLKYVSPRTGRAVSEEKGIPYRSKLLLLPAFLWKESEASEEDIRMGLKLTGYFLRQHSLKNRLPQVRTQL